MRITCSGMSVIVSDGELKVRDKKISIKEHNLKLTLLQSNLWKMRVCLLGMKNRTPGKREQG